MGGGKRRLSDRGRRSRQRSGGDPAIPHASSERDTVCKSQGELLKNMLHSELMHTIRAVHAGKRSFSPEVSFQVAPHVSDQTLTPGEVVVLRLIAAGNANKQIADQLAISEDTVKGRVKIILGKLDANDRTHAAIIGLKRGIIEL